MATAAPEAEAASRASQTPVLWSGLWPAVCGLKRVLPQHLCGSACPRSCPVLWCTLSPVQTKFLSLAESQNHDGAHCSYARGLPSQADTYPLVGRVAGCLWPEKGGASEALWLCLSQKLSSSVVHALTCAY